MIKTFRMSHIGDFLSAGSGLLALGQIMYQVVTYKYNIFHLFINIFTLFLMFQSDRIARIILNIQTQAVTSMPKARNLDFPRFWELFAFVLTSEVRETVYDPACQELLKAHLLARRYRTPWARRWLRCAFTFRTALLVADCLHAMLKDRLATWFPWIVAAWQFFSRG